jgi:hypothetical protein
MPKSKPRAPNLRVVPKSTPEEVAGSIAEHLGPLQALAKHANLPTVAYILDVALLAAQNAARRKDEP